MDKFKLRITYGYNGNVDKTTSAYLTAGSALTPYNLWNAFNTRVINPPNPSLAWEQVRNINFGIDFSTKGNILSGSVEYYLKNSFDLIANSPIAPQSGIQRFKGNSADMRTSGVDITLHANIFNGKFKWNADALISFNKTRLPITNGRREIIYPLPQLTTAIPLKAFHMLPCLALNLQVLTKWARLWATSMSNPALIMPLY